VSDAAPGGYKVNDLVMGVVTSDAFRAKRVPAAAAEAVKTEGQR
jgi:hypothetical protein